MKRAAFVAEMIESIVGIISVTAATQKVIVIRN